MKVFRSFILVHILISQNSDDAPLWWIMFRYEYLKWPILGLNIESPKHNFLSGKLSNANISYFLVWHRKWRRQGTSNGKWQQNWAAFLRYLRCWPSLFEEPCHSRCLLDLVKGNLEPPPPWHIRTQKMRSRRKIIFSEAQTSLQSFAL